MSDHAKQTEENVDLKAGTNDPSTPTVADTIAEDDPHKVEKLANAGHEGDAAEASE